MTCEKAAEFVSALYDGETVPREAAEHIGQCPACQEQLRTYIEMGVALRRMASLEIPETVPGQAWKAEAAGQGTLKTAIATGWRKGWESMRIPRFAFAAMVAGILVLASGLAMTKVRARSDGSVVMLKILLPDANTPIACPLSLVDKQEQSCDMSSSFGKGPRSYMIKLLGKQDDRLILGIRTTAVTAEEAAAHGNPPITGAPQNQYVFTLGETLRVAMGSFGDMQITGEWTDHMPAFNGEVAMDPGLDDLRIVSPMIVEGGRVLADWEGNSGFAKAANAEAMLYSPGTGRFRFYTSPHPNTTEGTVDKNRVKFEIDGKKYELITGIPITRASKLWVGRDASYHPSRHDYAVLAIGAAGKVDQD
ncbi:hypothetical protein [Silvibacterium dinghuense]|uniref:Zinc-finger domain-containing protein n=1 Tax=Silvibacterium dinghuense TaxID=1560006 RepID=A0A4Q1SJS3_9BACT|nr:hypothetical protein [Silvibacterium dinghuense]RXS97689.1 hypothetical protein ESZ00_07395 [Silvibacterium dinghuense]GGH01191.1 hypothetical protein GCM10011586_16000 [Silvibacterium dinghuense]